MIREKLKEFSLIGEVFRDSGLSLTSVPFFRRGEDFTDADGQVHYAADYVYPRKSSLSYAYCSDTAYYEAIIPHIENVTLLYHEATFTETLRERAKVTFHSTALQAATIAQKAGVKRLLLGHLSARYENGELHAAEARTVFENTLVAEDGNVYRV